MSHRQQLWKASSTSFKSSAQPATIENGSIDKMHENWLQRDRQCSAAARPMFALTQCLQYDPSQNDAADCSFHPGAPLFHEGLKSYSCCNTINKPVMTFDDFLKIPGCTTGSHSSEKSEVKAPVITAKVQESGSAPVASTSTEVPVVASTSTGPPVYKSRPTSPSPAAATNGSTSPTPTLAEEQDPADASIPEGSKCKRAACNCSYEPSIARSDEECQYHPLPAIFHEGSKGYACCKRRVLEFDEFLKIEGCKKGKHLFVGQPKEGTEMVTCRSDMYQTPTQVGFTALSQPQILPDLVFHRSLRLSSENKQTRRNRK